MDFERFNRFQWCLIGLFVGLLVAVSQSLFSGDYGGHSLDKNFDMVVAGTAQSPGRVGFLFGPQQWSYLSDIVVHPPVPEDRKTDPGGNSPAGTPIYWVTGKLHEMKLVHEGRKIHFDEASVSDFFHRGPAPYVIYGKTYPTVMAFLDDVAKQSGGKSAHYRFAWWERPVAIWSIYPVAGVLLIGGVWPFMIQLMARLGLGRRRDSPTGDLAGYRSAPAPVPQPKPAISDEDEKRLDVITATMEAELTASANVLPVPTAQPSPIGEPRPLETTPLGPATAKSQRAKSFGEADYYPTEIHPPNRSAESNSWGQ